jgi:hypothetical protein
MLYLLQTAGGAGQEWRRLGDDVGARGQEKRRVRAKGRGQGAAVAVLCFRKPKRANLLHHHNHCLVQVMHGAGGETRWMMRESNDLWTPLGLSRHLGLSRASCQRCQRCHRGGMCDFDGLGFGHPYRRWSMLIVRAEVREPVWKTPAVGTCPTECACCGI